MSLNFWWCFSGASEEKITSWLKRLEIAEDAAKGVCSASFARPYLYIEYGQLAAMLNMIWLKNRYRVSAHRMLPNNHP
jgi:hypothetical protein